MYGYASVYPDSNLMENLAISIFTVLYIRFPVHRISDNFHFSDNHEFGLELSIPKI